jgi:uncharacterized protein YjbI with pentapeptide repeats
VIAMQTRAIGALTVLLPADADELDETSDVPREHGLVADRLVTGDVWSRANLGGVTLSRCRLVNADLSSTVFDDVTMDRCILRGCSLVGARLASVTMKNVIFENCRLDYATLNGVRATGPTAFLGCSFTNTTLTACVLPGVVINDCKLAGTELDGCDLRRADLTGNNLSGIDGATSLRAAVISQSQVPGLTEAIIRELKITIKNDI